jgi:hypothetical protein
MPWTPATADIHAAWQPEIEFAAEASSTPVLFCGGSAQVLDLLPALLAAGALAAARADLTAPLLPAGGPGPGWLALLLLERPAGAPPPSPDHATLFAGADQASVLASGQTARTPARFAPPMHDLGSGYDALLRPRLEPAAPPRLESLPFWLATVPAPAVPTPGDAARAAWAAWAGVALALLMLVVALFA